MGAGGSPVESVDPKNEATPPDATAPRAQTEDSPLHREATFYLSGLDCRGCARHAQQALASLAGVRAASVRFIGEMAQVVYDARRTSEREIADSMRRAGYRLLRVDGVPPSARAGLGRIRLGLSIVLFAELVALSTAHPGDSGATGLGAARLALAAIVLLVGGFPVAQRAARRAREGVLGRDAIVTLAAVASFVLGVLGLRGDGSFAAWHGFETAGGIVVFALLARTAYASLWGRALGDLSAGERDRVTPARRVGLGDELERVPREALAVGDVVRVLEGEIAPADLRVDAAVRVAVPDGGGRFTEAAKEPGEVVSSGSVVLSPAAVTGRVVRPYRAGIAAALDAEAHRVLARIERELGSWSSREGWTDVAAQALFAASFTFALFSLVAHAALAGGFPRPGPWFAAIAVLASASPSAFVLAAPLARAIAVVRARSAGVLVRDARALEALARVDVVCCEKRGTITTGDLRVTGLVWRAATPDRSILEDVLTLEQSAAHPAARAIAAYLRARGIEPSPVPATEITEANGVAAGRVRDALVEVGSGPRFGEASAHEAPASASIAWFARNGVPLGYFVLADPLRPQADLALRALWQRGMRCRILSGDRRQATQSAANRVGITGFGGLTPSGKALMVRDLQHGGARVLYVRDGEDDGRVAAHADVSIAIAPGTLPSAVNAPILLTDARLDRLPWLVDLARALRARLRSAAAVAIVFNAAALPLAAVGKLTALHGAALMLLETLFVLGNAARLLIRPAHVKDAPVAETAPPPVQPRPVEAPAPTLADGAATART